MRKNIFIGFLILVSILSIVYGAYQKQRADKFEALAIANEKRAIEINQSWKMQSELAFKNAEEAKRQSQIAAKKYLEKKE